MLAGCVSTVNEDNARAVPRRGHVLTGSRISQTFVAGEDGLDAVQVALRTKGGDKPAEIVQLEIGIRDLSAGGPARVSKRRLTLMDKYAFYTIPFRAVRDSRDHLFEVTLSEPANAPGAPKTEVAVSTRNPYKKGRAGGSSDVDPDEDLLFRTEIQVGARTALGAFAGRLLSDIPFMVFYALLLTGLVAAAIVVWRKPVTRSPGS